MMEVACRQCGAKYQFDAAAIPAAGYDAQCTSCGNVFFVAPKQADAEPGTVSVSCVHCGAVYQFPASAIPPEGYDAQCTQCHKVFFVTAQGPAPVVTSPAPVPTAASAPEVAPAPVAPTPVKALVSAPAIPSPAPVTPAPIEPAPVVLETKKATPAAAVAHPLPGIDEHPDEESADMIALSTELGDPAPAPRGTSPLGDFEKIMARRRRFTRVVFGSLGLLLAYVLVTYFFVPRVFDLTLGRVLGIKLAVVSEAVPHVERAGAGLLSDTEAGYAEALAELDQALKIDARYPDAVALAAMVHTFRGLDLQRQGREMYDLGSRATAQIKAFEELPADKRAAQTQAIEALHKTAAQMATESGRLFEAAGVETSAALELLRPALKEAPNHPLLHVAAGVFYTGDADGLGRAQELLRRAVELKLGTKAQLNLKDPPDGWFVFLQGAIRAASRGGEDDAQAAFAAAVAKEPKLMRARWELVRLALVQGKREEARRQAAELVALAPQHLRAKAVLATIPAVVTPVDAKKTEKPTVVEPATKGKKPKAKRRR